MDHRLVFSITRNWRFACVALLIAGIVYRVFIRNWSFFTVRHVKFVRQFGINTVLLQLLKPTQRQRNLPQLLCDDYQRFPGERIIGSFGLDGKPFYVFRDPELIKRICIKDADHFVNHRYAVDVDCDPLVGRSLFFMKNAQWRRMRPTLSPLFTGHKMRLMFEIIDSKSRGMVEYLQTSTTGGGGTLELEMKDVCKHYATDVIASFAFGLDINSLANRSNEFYAIAKRVNDFDGWRTVAFVLCTSWPAVAKFCGITLAGGAYREYFTAMAMGVMRHRRETGNVRGDMIDLLIRLSDVERTEGSRSDDALAWTDDDLVAQCMGFFFAGFEPVANHISFMMYEITVNRHVQHQLYEEIQHSKRINGTQLTYTALNGLAYLDAVATECLRKWTPTIVTDRCVNRAYDVQLSDGGPTLRLQPGDEVVIPIHAIHMDPAVYPEPDTFRPERFLGTRKAEHAAAATFLPFGVGVRNCVGSRFALLEAKLVIYYLLDRFAFEASERTAVPLRVETLSVAWNTRSGIWVRLRPRSVEG